MKIEEVLKIDFTDKNVLIIGCPSSGKTRLIELINSNEHTKIHTDDYIKFGYAESLYKILEDLKNINEKTIVEGVQGYRMLRKGVELDCYYPDVVIQLLITEEKMIETYKNERDEKKIKYLKGFNKSHEKILNDYFNLENNKKPLFLNVINEF